MVELRILTGKMVGQVVSVRHFPFYIGRALDCDLRLEEQAVWNKHLKLDLRENEIIVSACGEGSLTVNGIPKKEAEMKIGDEIECGSVKIDCWASPVAQKSQAWRELFVYAVITGLLLLEVLAFFALENL